MTVNAANLLIRKFQSQIQDKLGSGQNFQPTYHRYCMAGRMSESGPDTAILQFLHTVADEAKATPQANINGVVFFAGPDIISEEQFEQLFMLRMQALQHLDQATGMAGVKLPSLLSAGWVVELINRQFYVIGLHPTHRLRALRFPFPSLVFDTQPHIANETARLDALYRQCLS